MKNTINFSFDLQYQQVQYRNSLTDITIEFRKKANGTYCKPRLDGTSLKFVIKNMQTELILTNPREANESNEDLLEIGMLLESIFESLWSQKILDEDECSLICDKIDKLAKMWTTLFNLHEWNNSCHVLHKHVPYYLQRYGNLYFFNQESVESKIGRNKIFLKQTASKSSNNTTALLQFDNRRLERIETIVLQKMKVPCKCGKTDHSRTSSKKCILNTNFSY